MNPSKKSPFLRLGLEVGTAILSILFATFFLAVLHEALLVGVANALRWGIETKTINQLIEYLVFSSVHRSMIIAGFGVNAEGIAVAGLVGEWLHRTLPSFFLEPATVAPGAWVSAVLAKENTAMFGLFVARGVAEIIFLVFGWLLIRFGLPTESLLELLRFRRFSDHWLGVSGLYVLAQAVWSVCNILKFISLQDTGIGLFITQVLKINDVQGYTFMMEEFLPWAIPLGIFATAIGLISFLDLFGRLCKRLFAGSMRISWAPRGEWGNNISANLLISIGFVFMFILSMLFPANSLGRQNYRDSKTSTASISEPTALALTILPSSLIASGTPNPQVVAAPASPGIPTTKTTPTPRPISVSSQIAIIQPPAGSPKKAEIRYSPAGSGFVLTFNGMRGKIRAVNYNVNYTQESEAGQIELYRQDFDIIKKAGFTAVTGYGIFNETMLKVAEEKELYVVMPFELDPTADYLGDRYSKQTKLEFIAFLDRIKGYARVVIINVGGDELATQMEIKHPAPLEHSERYKQIQKAVNFEFELAELAYKTTALPTLLKEHGEFFLPYIESATLSARAQGKEPEKYIIVGVDIYGRPAEVASRLENIIIPWVIRKLRLALMVSEFAPSGGQFSERPEDYRKILSGLEVMLKKYYIVGYAVYCLFNDEARPENRLVNDFGLLNSKREPVDNSLAEMADALKLPTQIETDLRNKKRPLLEIHQNFHQIVEKIGGYPTSGIIERDVGGERVLEQYFADGYKDGRAIAYKLVERGATIEIQDVGRAIFNSKGDYILEGAMLEAYMVNGGYGRFGAPISNAYPSAWNNTRGVRQDFATGYSIFVEDGPTRPSTIITPHSSSDFGRKVPSEIMNNAEK